MRPPSSFLGSACVALLHLSLFLSCYAVSEIKINAGGLKLGDYDADPVSFVSGPNEFYRYVGSQGAGLGVGLSHRWAALGGFTYNIPTGNGVFEVDLIFAEIWDGGSDGMKVGTRVFDVAIEDTVVLQNFDVYKEAGGLFKLVKKSITDIQVEDETITLTFIQKAAQNPMVSGILIRKKDGSDIAYVPGVSDEGTGAPQTPSVANKGFDHQAHAVAGGPYQDTDYNNDGEVTVELDGRGSHSHYNDPDTEESGFITSYSWKVNGKVIGTKPFFTYNFPVGKTKLTLTVKDNAGDSASAETEVTVLPSTAGGAFCYYYLGQKQLSGLLREEPKPDAGHSSETIDFEDDEFQYALKDENTWASLCLTDFTSSSTKQHVLGVKYEGAGAALYVNGVKLASDGPSSDGPKTISAPIIAQMGKTPIRILYYRNGPSGSLKFTVDGKVATPGMLGFQSSAIIPAISSTSVKLANVDGGGQMQIKGTGFFNNPKVKIGGFNADFNPVSSTVIIVTIPTAAQASAPLAGDGKVEIRVTNAAGISNAVTLQYSNSKEAFKGIQWEQTYLKSSSGGKYSLKQVTSIAIGPDSFYYVGSISGFVTKFSAGKNLVVKNICTGPKVGDNRAILGLAFNYKSKVNRAYVTTNTLYHAINGPFKGDIEGWANGKVETFTSGCGCLCYEGVVVSGLPVSNHDHGVNSLLFLPSGDLLISIGGATNAGHNTEGNKLGGWPETPLSGAIAVAKLSKSNFNGKIRYDQYVDAKSAKKISGDVEVYAAGFRNCFGMTLRTNGEVWATDNGGNFGYGDISTSCSSDIPFKNKQYDELNKVVKGNYYGHPNRNRGGPQCVFGTGTGSLLQLPSSTPGITEYGANTFGSELKEKLVLSKYAASGTGTLWRVEQSGNGLEKIPMADYSSLSVITGLHGELIMPRVQQGFVAVMKPKYSKPNTPFVIAVSPRRGYSGQRVYVSGENFGSNAVVTFNGIVASGVEVENGNGLYCKVPSGSGKVKVVVTVGGVSSGLVSGTDFIYT